jgi:hypothetical protein
MDRIVVLLSRRQLYFWTFLSHDEVNAVILSREFATEEVKEGPCSYYS